MDDGMPPEIRGELRRNIQAELLRAYSKYLDLRKRNRTRWSEYIREAYGVYAYSLRRAGWALTDTLLTESIPRWVFQWTVFKGLVRYPSVRPVPRGPIPNFIERWYREDPPPQNPPPFEPIPEAELTVQFGVYKVTESYKTWFMWHLASPIAYWQAEALEPAAARGEAGSQRDAEPAAKEPVTTALTPVPPIAVSKPVAEANSAYVSSLVGLFYRIIAKKRDISIDQWAHNHHIGRSSLFAWLDAGGRAVPKLVSKNMAEKIENAIRQDAAALGLTLDVETTR
jgi:hypothetical protein